MDDNATLVGRLVQSTPEVGAAQAREEMCLVVEDRADEVTLFPLALAVALTAAQGRTPKGSASAPVHLSVFSRHPWAFDAAKVVLRDHLLFFAKGHEYHFFGER